MTKKEALIDIFKDFDKYVNRGRDEIWGGRMARRFAYYYTGYAYLLNNKDIKETTEFINRTKLRNGMGIEL